jgi:hypothetical protein
MNKDELKRILLDEHVRTDAYDLDGGRGSEQYTLRESSGQWSVFYSERGLQTGLRQFYTENDACEYMLELLRNDASTRAE